MTVTTTTSKETLTGNGVQTVFPFTMRLLTGGDMNVYINGTPLVGGRTVAINSNGVGGTITFDTAPANGATVLLARLMTLTQDTDLPVESNIPEATLETAYDRAVMLIQQLKEEISRGFTLPITTTLSGALATDGSAGHVLRKKLTNDGYEMVSATVAFNDATPTLGTGNVVGPLASTDYTIVLWDGIGGKTLRNGVSLGTAGQILMSNGVGAAPTMVTRNWLFRAANITTTLRTLPTSGALSGTYVHFGNWTSTNTLTFAHDTRIYIKGDMTLNHTLTGVAQSNGGVGGSAYAFGGGRGGGPGGGDGGHAVHASLGLGGGAGGGNGGAGGRGGWNGTAGANQGGRVHGVWTAGGSGGGSGSGDLASTLGTAGGGGGGFLYIEIDGNLTLNETIAANGANGTAGVNAASGGGGGGAGGTVVIRGTGTLVILTAKKITTTGGNGGAETGSGRGGGGGGGGYVDIWTGGAHTVPDTAAVHFTATAGASGGGTPTTAPAAGSAGVTTILQSTAPISLF